jgi:hypothetical protein
MLGLAVTHVNAQGFNVSKSETYVVEHGRNQMLGAIRLDYTQSGGNIDDGRTIKVTYGTLELTGGGAVLCAGSFSTESGGDAETANANCITAVTTSFANDDDTDIGTVTINLGTPRPDSNQFGFVVIQGVRADVSGLSAGNTIVAAVNSSTAPTGFVPIGQDRTESVGGTVSTVMDGLDVAVGQASRLLCNIGQIDTTPDEEGGEVPVGGVPSITVSEGVPKAWETAMGGTMITIKMNSLPDGVNLRWPETVNFVNPADDDDTVWSTLMLTDASRRVAGMHGTDTNRGAGRELNTDTEDDADDLYAANNGEMVTYEYAAAGTNPTLSDTVTKNITTEKDSFKIEFAVEVTDLEKVGAGGISDIWAWLAPAGKSGDDDNRGTVLSYVMMPDTDPEVVMGDIINFGECVTYLLFPYVTCSSTDEEGAMMDPWTTAMAIANTTMDDGVFGISAGAAAQSGDITLHTFPRSTMGDDGMMMMMDMHPMTVAADLAAGDTWSDTCSNILPGFNGYIIAKAGFRQGHGVAFVLGMFPGGAGIDVAHGYLGLVIPDPEFGGDRAAASGETLGQ